MTSYYSDYTIKWATSDWEIEQSHELRRRIFCLEQGLFEQDDRDHIDDYAQCLIAVANQGGWHDKVVGTVRIHEEGNGVWWGSRLGVDTQYRTQVGLGSALIKLAVSSAHALGCNHFLAQVQKRNERLFQRLHWQSRFELMVHGQLHVMMQAELERFPPHHAPHSGFVLTEKPRLYEQELAPSLLRMNNLTGAHTAPAPEHYAA